VGWPARLRGLRAAPVWSDDDVRGLPVADAGLVSVGGGLASFVLMDLLRIAGVPGDDLRVVSPETSPVAGFRHLARSSQIGDRDRLRSDSSARVDNVWGFPGYAMSEARAERRLGPVLKVLAEPVAAEYFTPVSGRVYDGVAHEMARIGWDAMILSGRTELVRPRREGGFFALVISDNVCCSVLRSRYVHLGLGYPALRIVADLQRYRSQHGDSFSGVSAYEPHEHVYQALARHGGTVLVRGAGITASRVIERLIDERVASGAAIRIIHLVRRVGGRHPDRPGPHRPRRSKAAAAWDYQTFNFPKGAAGGQLAQRLARTPEAARPALLAHYGGTTTPDRSGWQTQLHKGSEAGWYRLVVGTVAALDATAAHRLHVRITDPAVPDIETDVEADFLIDCTGLQTRAADHPLLADLFERGLGRANFLGRLEVDEHFEIRQARNGAARAYATGPMALGSSIGPVDSFWGLNAAALAVADDLARLGFCDRIGMRRSVAGWWRWMKGRAP
jgi:hypothetical protein